MALAFRRQTQATQKHFPLTFRLLSARIRLHAPSDHWARNFWKSLNAISNLLVTVLSVSLLQLTVWNLPPASLQNLPTLSDFKAQLKTFLFQQTFPQIKADHGVCVCVCVCGLCLCVYLHEWCVLTHWVFLMERFALYKSHPLLLLLLFSSVFDC